MSAARERFYVEVAALGGWNIFDRSTAGRICDAPVAHCDHRAVAETIARVMNEANGPFPAEVASAGALARRLGVDR